MIKAIILDAGGVLYLKDENGRGYLNPSLLEFIKNHQDKYLFGIISTTDYDLEAILKQGGIRDLFEFVITTGNSHLEKTDKKIYQLALEKLNLKAAEVIFLDNKREYIQTANQLGIQTMLYTNFNDLKEKLV